MPLAFVCLTIYSITSLHCVSTPNIYIQECLTNCSNSMLLGHWPHHTVDWPLLLLGVSSALHHSLGSLVIVHLQYCPLDCLRLIGLVGMSLVLCQRVHSTCSLILRMLLSFSYCPALVVNIVILYYRLAVLSTFILSKSKPGEQCRTRAHPGSTRAQSVQQNMRASSVLYNTVNV